jgi:thienamycin biosynthesis protein ThnN
MTNLLQEISSEYLQHIIDIHFHPSMGSKYWINRQRGLKFKDVKSVKDFVSFKEVIGFQDASDQVKFENDTRTLPIEVFIPTRIINDNTRTIWVSQTGGTTGIPKHGCWDSEYWKNVMAYSDEFLDHHRIPRNCNWLFMGPMGPHTTGRLVVSICENRGGRCFSIDLDPRFVRIALNENLKSSYDRYIRHIWEQAESILQYQQIDVLFATSRLLEMAPEYIDMTLFKNIKGIIHAGTSLGRDANKWLTESAFKGTPIVGMYGTSTTGISYQIPDYRTDPYLVVYVPSSPFISLEIVDKKNHTVDYGSEGFIATYRLTEDYLIPGFWERDKGIRIKPEGDCSNRYPWDWVGGIYSHVTSTQRILEGVY